MIPYHLFLVPLAAGAIAQAVKLGLNGITGDFDVRHLLSEYGGMPSSHSAFVISLVTTIGLSEGLSSPMFAVALVYALITIRDAIGLRRTLERQSTILNALLKQNGSEKNKELPTLPEHVGHTPTQVFAGSVLGASVSALYFLLSNGS